MAANKFVICGPDGPTRAKRLQPQEWAAHQQTVTDLYVHQNKSLDDLMTIMASKYGLIARYSSSFPEMPLAYLGSAAVASIPKSFDSGKYIRTYRAKSCDLQSTSSIRIRGGALSHT